MNERQKVFGLANASGCDHTQHHTSLMTLVMVSKASALTLV